jgi:hypothetical protein
VDDIDRKDWRAPSSDSEDEDSDSDNLESEDVSKKVK